MRSKRSKATDISEKVRNVIKKRDGGYCVLCGNYGEEIAHFISRSRGGLGIEENLVTLCIICHRSFDDSKYHKEFEKRIENFLSSYYKDWNKADLIYDKWKRYKEIYKKST